MLTPQITTRDITISPALELLVRQKTEKLTRFYDRITHLKVVIEVPQKHQRQGRMYNVRIDLTVPRKELVVTRQLDQDVYVAIRKAFHAMQPKLEDYIRKVRGQVKTHEETLHGRVVRLMNKDGYGFIEGIDGNEYYFSMTNVAHPGFNQLMIGDRVEFIAEQVNDGQQAHRVVKESSRG